MTGSLQLQWEETPTLSKKENKMSIFDNLQASDFRTQFPRFTPMYLSDITYASGNTYFKDSVVYYETKFYKAKKDTTALPTVTTDWDLYNDSTLNYTTDNDILNAYNEAKVNFNEGLFSDDQAALMVFLYLTAYYLTVDFNNALGANGIGIATSRSVGSVSESYTIPQWINDYPTLAMYATNGYGVKYCTLIKPYLVGNVMLIPGKTTIA